MPRVSASSIVAQFSVAKLCRKRRAPPIGASRRRSTSALALERRTSANHPREMGERLFYGPNLCKSARVAIDGKEVYASNDCGTALSGFLIDATFLASLPSYGLQSMLPVATHELTVAGKTEMRVVGKLENVRMRICYDPSADAVKWFDVTAPQVFVVHSLPVPLHVSDGPVGRRAAWSSGGEPRHKAATYGAPYNSHPYWSSRVEMAPLGAGPTVGFVGTAPEAGSDARLEQLERRVDALAKRHVEALAKPRDDVFGMTAAQARAAIAALVLALLWQLLR